MITTRTLALFALLCVATPALADDLSAPGALLAARRDVTVVRQDGSSFAATIHYPGTSTAVGAPLNPAAGPYPIIAFGHGFLSPVTIYQSTGAHLATWGFVTILPQTQGGLLPSHGAFAADLVSSLDWLAGQATVVGSPWFGGVDGSRRGVMGHSMGGGCSLLAAQSDPRIRCVVPLAAANTNPSSITAALGVECATRLIVGSQDTIVTPSSTSAMYPNLAAPSEGRLHAMERVLECARRGRWHHAELDPHGRHRRRWPHGWGRSGHPALELRRQRCRRHRWRWLDRRPRPGRAARGVDGLRSRAV